MFAVKIVDCSVGVGAQFLNVRMHLLQTPCPGGHLWLIAELDRETGLLSLGKLQPLLNENRAGAQVLIWTKSGRTVWILSGAAKHL